MFAFTAEFQGDADADLLVRTHPMTGDISESSIDALMLAGYAAQRSLAQRPVHPRMPDSNAYHIACAEASLRWVRRLAAL